MQAKIHEAILNNNTKSILSFVDIKDANIGYNSSFIFKRMCKFGNFEVIKKIINDNRIDPTSNNNRAFQIVAENGFLDILKFLTKDTRINPADDHNYALFIAHKSKRYDVVDFLFSLDCVKNTLRDDQYFLYDFCMQRKIQKF